MAEVGSARVDAWRPDVCFSHNIGPLAIDRALTSRWPVVKMLHGFFGTCVSGLKMHALPAPVACARRCGPACLALYFPRRCGRVSLAAIGLLHLFDIALAQNIDGFARLVLGKTEKAAPPFRPFLAKAHTILLDQRSLLAPAGSPRQRARAEDWYLYQRSIEQFDFPVTP